MKVIVNGHQREVPDDATVASVVADVSPATTGIAVALNDEVVRRTAWAATTVRDADRLEILTAVQGG
jgi:sulfur carrier protein